MSKEQDSCNKKTKLTDAELQQATGGMKTTSQLIKECEAQGDKANCEKRNYCQWYEGKDGHYCYVAV